MDKKTNPLFPIATEKHKEDLLDKGYWFLDHSEANESTYTLGLCRGVAYATGIFHKQIEELQRKLSEMESKEANKLLILLHN
tara:strand:+ start:5140 stop:5385 length:246 start_codon:yes stop_codon:yes gene_type:complete